MPAVDALRYSLSHFDNSDIWFKASYDLNVKTGWLGRWIDSNGSATNPLQAISIDTALSKSIRTAVNPVCAIPSLTSLGFNMSLQGAVGGTSVNAQMQALAGVPAAAHNAYLARARGTYGVAVETHQRSLAAGTFTPGAGYPHRDAGEPAEARRPPAGGEPRHARSSRSTGAASTPTAASSPARTPS